MHRDNVYYQIKQKAILNFRRALRLCPTYLAVWVLMGHEYVQLRNSTAAIEWYHIIAFTFSVCPRPE
jgi:tetratricopeptide (TPR) repeat protein